MKFKINVGRGKRHDKGQIPRDDGMGCTDLPNVTQT